MAITLLSIFAIERLEAENRAARQQETASAIVSALERRATSTTALLRAGAAFVATKEDFSGQLFGAFVEELWAGQKEEGAEGVGWAPMLATEDIPAFQNTMSRTFGVPFTVDPVPTGPDEFAIPVAFLYPPTVRNRRAVGYNMYSEAHRREAMLAAVRTASPTASGPVVLKQEGGGQANGFLIYMPVFSQADESAPMGFVYSPFNARDFLDAALVLEPGGQYKLELFDVAAGDTLIAEAGQSKDARGHIESGQLTLADRKYRLQLTAPRTHALSTLSLLTLVFGLLVSSLLAFVARMLTQQSQDDEHAIGWFEEQNSIRNSLTRELDHRVKNTLANVLSIIALTRRRSSDLDEFADGLTGRIRALSATHDLLSQSEWNATQIRSVIDAELAPYALDRQSHNLVVEGPDVALAPNDALSLGLAVHELATNAAKYGALSQAGGHISIRWHRVRDNLAEIEWVERGGPTITDEPKRGFGLDLIEKIVAHELGNPIDLSFEADGVRCVLLVPIRRPSEFVPRAASADS